MIKAVRNESACGAQLQKETPMNADNRTVVQVRTQWSGWRTALVAVGDLQNLHWFQPPGAPRPIVHAHVSCTDVVSGTLAHDCGPGDGPHRLLVCILKHDVVPGVYSDLAHRADVRPPGGCDGSHIEEQSKSIPALEEASPNAV